MPERHLSRMRRLIQSVLSSRGTLAPEVRRAIAAGEPMPGPLHQYTEKVHRHAYRVTDEDTAELLRAGYSHNDNPIRSQDVTFNILAPGVIEDHVTLGFTYKTKSGGELTMFYMHAFENSVTGPSLFNRFGVPAGNETIKMHQDSIGIAYGWKM